MGTTIIFRRGENDPTSGSGLTLAEPAFNTTLKTFHIGLGHGVTAAWVGAPISGLSADIAAGITYKTPTASAVKNYIGGLCYGNTGAATITQYVSSFNGLTGAVGGVCAAQANTFTALQSFTNGISLSGGLTADQISITGYIIQSTDNPLSIQVNGSGSTPSSIGFDVYGNVSVSSDNDSVASFRYDGIQFHKAVNANGGITASDLNVTGNANISGNLTVSGGVTFTASEIVLIEDNIITLNSNVTGSPSENAGIEIERGTSANVQLLWNESSDKWTFTNDGSTYYDLPTSVVTSFNGLTGAVQGVSAAVAGTGISVSGATGAVTITNIGVQSFNGNTGAVTGASLGANTFTGLNSFNAGISSFGGTFSGNIVQFMSGLSASLVRIGSLESNGTNPVTFADNKFKFTVLGFPSSFYTTLQADVTTSADRTITLPNSSGTVALTSQLMSAVNGSTAATTAVTSFNGLTGAVGGVCAAQANTFTALNSFNAGISAAGGTFSALTQFTAGLSGHINITETNATGNMYLLMARGTGVTAVFADTTTTPLVYQASAGNLGLKGITLANGNDRLYITPTQITATNTVTPSSAYFYFIAAGGNYLQSPIISQMGDIAAENNALCLNVDPSKRTMTWGDGVFLTGVTSGFFGVNRSPSGMCADYAVEINSPTGKGLQLIYNDYTGAASNWVNMDVSSGGNYTLLPSGGLATVTGTLNVSAGVCAAGATFSGNISAPNIVTSFNGRTGAVGGVCAAQANTFTALQTFSSGLTATGITTGTITNSSSISVTSKGGTVTLKGITTGTALVANSITLSPLTTTNLSLNSATGIVDVNRGWEGVQSAYSSGLKFVNYDESFYYSNTLLGNASADRTIYLPDASGTLALTSQLMGAVNGSTAATSAVTSFNGRTGAVQGVSAAVAGTGISVSGATGSVTITNIGVQSFNGNTGAVTGASLGANTFTALNSFNAGISAAGGTFSALTRFTAGISASGGMTLAGSLQGSTASFSGQVTIDKSSAFGITAESRFAVKYNTYSNAVDKLYSYYTSTSSLSGVTICKIPYASTFENVSGSFKITISNTETSAANPYNNFSTFMVSLSNSTTLNWSEIFSFNGLNIPVYNLSYDGDYISISVTQTVSKFGSLIYVTETERVG